MKRAKTPKNAPKKPKGRQAGKAEQSFLTLPSHPPEAEDKTDESPSIVSNPQLTHVVAEMDQRAHDPTEEAAGSVKVLQLIAFLLENEEYGVDISMVKEIIRVTEVTSVPRAPSYIKGIISLRGTVLPIFDLRQLLSMPDFKPGKKNRILVVGLEAGPIGIIVDAVTEVIELKEEELEPPPAVMTSLEAEHIRGMGRYKDRLIIVLDLEKVYRTKHGRVKSIQEENTPVSP